MKRKVRVIALLTVAVILLAFAGCGSKSQTKKAETYNDTAAQIESVLQKVPAEEG